MKSQTAILFSLFVLVALASCTPSNDPNGPGIIVVPVTADSNNGKLLYESGLGCSGGGCHSIDGSGNDPVNPSPNTVLNNWLPGTWTFSALQAKINDDMPFGAAASCQGQCAADTAAHIACAFNPNITTGC